MSFFVHGIHIFSIVFILNFPPLEDALQLLAKVNEAITSDGDQSSTGRCSQGLRGHEDDKWWPGKGEHERFPATCTLMLKVNVNTFGYSWLIDSAPS